MKKLWIITGILLFLGLVICVIIGMKRVEEEAYYTIPQAKSYIYKKNGRMSFDVYSNKEKVSIALEDENTYLLQLDDLTYTLEDVSVELIQKGKLSLFRIYANIPEIFEEDAFYERAVLKIKNSKYEVILSLGTLSLLNPIHHLLVSVDTIYPSYSYINGELHLVGINICFTHAYSSMQSFRIGSMLNGALQHAIPNEFFENELDIKKVIPTYQVEAPADNKPLTMESRKYFIPLNYKKLFLVQQGYLTMELDNKSYYFDTFSFIQSEIRPMEYEKRLCKGVIEHA